MGDVGTKGEDKASTCFLARLRQEMLLCRACPHGLVSFLGLPATTLWLCRADQPRPLEPAGWVGSASLRPLQQAAADLGIFCCQIFRFLKKNAQISY